MAAKTLKERIKIFKKKLKNGAANELSFRNKLDSIWCRLFYGFNVEQYIANDIYKLNHRARREFFSTAESLRISNRMMKRASKEELHAIGNKFEFEKQYSDFVHRAVLSTKSAGEEEIRDFLDKHEEVIVKPFSNSQGRGIKRLVRDPATLSETAAELAAGSYCIEEFVKQHHALSEINPSSVNTLRIATVLDKQGESHIVGACLRVGGKDSYVDNFHAGGVAYPVDIENGVVCGRGFALLDDKRVYRHPSTGKMVLGFQIPNWEIAKHSVLEAAKRSKELRYLGWDVAILEDGIEFIEANIGMGPTTIQIDGIGKRKLIRKLLK